jgi:hypothetical protein
MISVVDSASDRAAALTGTLPTRRPLAEPNW